MIGNFQVRFLEGGGLATARFHSATALGQFSGPKGLNFGPDGSLIIVDSGNSRLALSFNDEVDSAVGSSGTAIGQYSTPLNASADIESIYVADTGNNRVTKIGNGRMTPLWQISSIFSPALSSPSSVSVGDNSIEERVYIADTGNNRIAIVAVPRILPDPVWNAAKSHLSNGETEDALASFSVTTVDSYRSEFANLGPSRVAQYIGDIGVLTPAYIDSDESLYYFTSMIDGTEFTFFITFVKEKGQWKIRTF